VLKSSEGWEIPCQPCLNSSINFFIGIVTSRDQRIQNMAEHIENRGFRGPLMAAKRLSAGNHGGTSVLALLAKGREYRWNRRREGTTTWDGWTARLL
jgi:hypothetical protein